MGDHRVLLGDRIQKSAKEKADQKQAHGKCGLFFTDQELIVVVGRFGAAFTGRVSTEDAEWPESSVKKGVDHSIYGNIVSSLF